MTTSLPYHILIFIIRSTMVLCWFNNIKAPFFLKVIILRVPKQCYCLMKQENTTTHSQRGTENIMRLQVKLEKITFAGIRQVAIWRSLHHHLLKWWPQTSSTLFFLKQDLTLFAKSSTITTILTPTHSPRKAATLLQK